MEIDKILLVIPPFSLEKRYGKGLAKIGTLIHPLGICYIASILEGQNYNVEILDTQVEDMDFYDTIKYCEKSKPDVIGMYCNTSNYNVVMELSKEIKKSMDIKIVVGGPQATIDGKQPLSNPAIDYVIFGEAEETFKELINAIKENREDLGDIDGISWRKNNIIITNKPREWIKNLDDIPFPARHLLKLELYSPSPQHYKELPYFNMTASRGCPFSCIFCSSGDIWNHRYRLRSADNVIAEIKSLKEKYGARDIGFWDDIFGIKQSWIEEFCDKMIEQKIDVNWSCEFRVDTAKPDLLKKMKKAGCWCIFYGIESLDQEILDAINKQTTVQKIRDALKWTKEAGIEIRANFIIGNPAETPEKFKKVVEEICTLDLDYVKFNVMTPYPGTRLYEEIKQGKWGTMTEETDKLTNYFTTFKPHGYESLEQIDQLKKWAYRKIYLRPKFIVSRMAKIRSFTDIKRNLDGALALVKI